MAANKSRNTYEMVSSNVLADIDLPNAEERLVKVRLVSRIFDVTEARGRTQKHAAQVLGVGVLGVSQPDVPKITCGQLRDSVPWSMSFLAKLDNRIAITVSSDELPMQEIVVAASSPSRKQVSVK